MKPKVESIGKIYVNVFAQLKKRREIVLEIAQHKEAIRQLKYKLKGQKDPFDTIL